MSTVLVPSDNQLSLRRSYCANVEGVGERRDSTCPPGDLACRDSSSDPQGLWSHVWSRSTYVLFVGPRTMLRPEEPGEDL